VYVKQFKCKGMHSKRLVAIYLQNTNAMFHKVV